MSDMKKLIESMDRLAGTGDQIPGDQVKGTEKYPFLHRLVGESDLIGNPFTKIALDKIEKLSLRRNFSMADKEALCQSVKHNINRYGANKESIDRILDMFDKRASRRGDLSFYGNKEAIKQALLYALKQHPVPVEEMINHLQNEYDTFLNEGYLRTGREAVQRQIEHLESKGYTIEDDPDLEYVFYYKKDGCPTYRVNYRTSDSKGGEEIRRMDEEQIDEYGSVGSSAPLPQAQPGQVPPAPGNPPTANVAVPGQPPVTAASSASPPVPGQAVPPVPTAGKPVTGTPGAQSAAPAVTPEQVAMGFLAGMGNKNPSPAEVTNMARMLGKGMSKVK